MIYIITSNSFHSPEGAKGNNREEWLQRMADVDRLRDNDGKMTEDESNYGAYELLINIAAHGKVKTLHAKCASFISRRLKQEGHDASITLA